MTNVIGIAFVVGVAALVLDDRELCLFISARRLRTQLVVWDDVTVPVAETSPPCSVLIEHASRAIAQALRWRCRRFGNGRLDHVEDVRCHGGAACVATRRRSAAPSKVVAISSISTTWTRAMLPTCFLLYSSM